MNLSGLGLDLRSTKRMDYRESRFAVCVPGLLIGLVLAVPSVAAAAPNCGSQSVPSTGNSELDQYVESVPGDCGDEAIDRSRDPAGSAVPTQTAAELDALGPAGAAAAEVAEATAPSANGGGGGGIPATDGSRADRRDSRDQNGGTPAAHVIDALGGDSNEGVGFLLPLILAGTLLAGAAFYAYRRRTRG